MFACEYSHLLSGRLSYRHGQRATADCEGSELKLGVLCLPQPPRCLPSTRPRSVSPGVGGGRCQEPLAGPAKGRPVLEPVFCCQVAEPGKGYALGFPAR